MYEYEITYLIDPQTEEEGRDTLNSAVDAKINDLGGVIMHADPTTRRRLAYTVDKKTSAFIRSLQIQLEPANLKDIHDTLKRTQGVMRFTILNTPRRQHVAPELLARQPQKGTSTRKKEVARVSKKKVSMEDVEKGIEEALSEEVK